MPGERNMGGEGSSLTLAIEQTWGHLLRWGRRESLEGWLRIQFWTLNFITNMPVECLGAYWIYR